MTIPKHLRPKRDYGELAWPILRDLAQPKARHWYEPAQIAWQFMVATIRPTRRQFSIAGGLAHDNMIYLGQIGGNSSVH